MNNIFERNNASTQTPYQYPGADIAVYYASVDILIKNNTMTEVILNFIYIDIYLLL